MNTITSMRHIKKTIPAFFGKQMKPMQKITNIPPRKPIRHNILAPLGLTVLLLALFAGANAAEPLTDLSDIDQPPSVLRSIQPDYPDELRRIGKVGRVVVEAVVDSEGRVVDPRIIESADERFNSSALFAFKQWLFKPGMKNKQAVAARIRVPFNFAIADAAPAVFDEKKAKFPPAMKGTSGEVTLELQIDDDGKVTQTRVVESTEAGFNESAQTSASRWRFYPKREGGRYVATSAYIRFHFAEGKVMHHYPFFPDASPDPSTTSPKTNP